MKVSAGLSLTPPEDLLEEHLTSINLTEMKEKVKESAPIFWKILHCAAYTQLQEKQNRHKDPDIVQYFNNSP